MNTTSIITSIIIILFLFSSCKKNTNKMKENQSVLNKSPYFNMDKPELNEKKLDFNSMSKEYQELTAKFNINEEEFYFTQENKSPFLPAVIVFRKDNKEYNAWNKYDFYSIDADNDTILYCKNLFIKKTNNGWSKIKSLGPEFDRKDWFIMSSSASINGTLIFDDFRSGDVIRSSEVRENKRQKPVLLSKNINAGKWTAHPYIAPDESYLIWDSEREEGSGGSDLYISFKQSDNSWGKAINLGAKINSNLHESGGRVTSDGKYLFFTRSEEKINKDGTTKWISSKHWIDAKIIDSLRPVK